MTNRRFNIASRMLTATMTVLCGACATMDSDGDRVGTPKAINPYGVYVPPNIQQQAFAQTYYTAPYVAPAAPSSSYTAIRPWSVRR